MHWLANRIQEIEALSERHRRLRETDTAAAATRGREEVMRALGRLVEEVSARPGVLAAFVSHEGLLIARAGDGGDFDALAALAEQSVRQCAEAARRLSLGGARQVLIAGADRKLALVVVGPWVVGILSAEGTSLAQSLER